LRRKRKLKVIGFRTYAPIEGAEKDDIHFNFTKELAKKVQKLYYSQNPA